MSVITISRQSGSEGNEIAEILCERLGYRLFNKQLIVRLANEHNWDSSPVEELTEDEHQILSAVQKAFGYFRTPIASHSFSRYLPYDYHTEIHLDRILTERLIRAAYQLGDVVIVGRASQVILADKPDVLHVRVVAPEEQRIQTWQKRGGLSYETAKKIVHERDKAHLDFVRTYFEEDLNQCSLYDLNVNTNKFTPSNAADLIIAALGMMQVESQHGTRELAAAMSG